MENTTALPREIQPGMEEETQLSFTDWAQFVSFTPKLYFRPQNLDELKRFISGQRQGFVDAQSLRVLGGLHSCSDICVSEAIVDVSDLPKTIEYDEGFSAVTVSANWHLHDFLRELSAHGKSISATGGTDKQTLAGLISTATAPASSRNALYDLLEWVEYITYDEITGSVTEKHVSTEEPTFPALVASLGAIGILTKVHFKLVDELYFETIQKVIGLNDVLGDLEKTSAKYDFWRIDWIPDTDKGLLWAARRISPQNPDGDYPVDQSENILVAVFRLLDQVESAGAILDNAMRLLYAGLVFTYGEIKVSGPLRNMLPVDRRAPLHVAMAEWSFNPADLSKVMGLCRSYYQKNGWPNLPIEIELTKTDHYWMSPWNWTGLDFIVKFNFMYLTDISQTGPEKDEIRAHLQGLWNHLIQAGVPFKAHWGKLNFMNYDFVRQYFAIEEFKPFIRSIFVNPYLRDRILPPAA